MPYEGPRDGAATHLTLVRRRAGGAARRRTRPCVVVLDNDSVHHSQPVKAALPELETASIHFCFLPPYSPELNPIEPVWRQVTYQDIPERSHPTATALQTAVESTLADPPGLTPRGQVKLGRRVAAPGVKTGH